MSRTNGSICSRAAAEGRITRSMPSSRMFSSASVMSTATSTSSSTWGCRPVISQSIQTRGALSGVGVLVSLMPPGYSRVTMVDSSEPRPRAPSQDRTEGPVA